MGRSTGNSNKSSNIPNKGTNDRLKGIDNWITGMDSREQEGKDNPTNGAAIANAPIGDAAGGADKGTDNSTPGTDQSD